MNKKYKSILIFFSILIVLILVTIGDVGTYVTFSKAKHFSSLGSDKDFHVVGILKKNSYGDVLGVKKKLNGLSFSFIMIDNDNIPEEVYYNEPIPIDFVKSEQIVVIGSYKNNRFLASKLLMKCPSKYKEEKVDLSI